MCLAPYMLNPEVQVTDFNLPLYCIGVQSRKMPIVDLIEQLWLACSLQSL